jgi:hypothetical protein
VTPMVRLPVSTWTSRLHLFANLAVGGTGLVYWWMKEMMSPADEWSVLNHPWQGHVQHLHVVLAPLLVFLVGLVWQRHVAPGWRRGTHNRWSGMGMALNFVPMVASGYLLQVSSDEAWRSAWGWLHAGTGALWVVATLAHMVRSLQLRRRAAAQPRAAMTAAAPEARAASATASRGG